MRSVLAQRGVRLEVVIVDDGGSDGTPTRVAEIGDRRVRLVRNDASLGVSLARNVGLGHVRSQWVAFLDDDDLWAPDKLARQLEAIGRDPSCRWACSAAATFFADGKVLSIQAPSAERNLGARILEGNLIPGGGSSVLVETGLLRKVGGFDATLSNLADWDCWVRLAQRSPIASVQSPDVAYRLHPTSMAHDLRRSEEEVERLRLRYADHYLAHDVELDRSAWLRYLGWLAYSGGDRAEGIRRSLQLYKLHGHRRALWQPVRSLIPLTIRRRSRARLFASRQPVEHAFVCSWLLPLLAPVSTSSLERGSPPPSDAP